MVTTVDDISSKGFTFHFWGGFSHQQSYTQLNKLLVRAFLNDSVPPTQESNKTLVNRKDGGTLGGTHHV